MLGYVLQAGILWFLISYFTRSTGGGYKQAITITLIVVVCNFLMGLTIRPIIGEFTTLISIAILYFAIEKICDTSRRTTLWITGSYLVITLFINLILAILMTPVEAGPMH